MRGKLLLDFFVTEKVFSVENSEQFAINPEELASFFCLLIHRSFVISSFFYQPFFDH